MDIRDLHVAATTALQQWIAAGSSSTSDRQRRRVLLVDGNRHRRIGVARSLRQQGLDVVVARSGREAIDLALLAQAAAVDTFSRDEAFDLILMSPQLPDMEGSQVVRCLREKGYNVPIVAHADSRDRAVPEPTVGFRGGAGTSPVAVSTPS